jgi:hypothetical protein
VATFKPDDPDALLRRGASADALTEAGFPITKATLATKASRGGGPPFRLFGRVPLYRWGDLLDWAQSRLSDLVRSTSEIDLGPRYTESDNRIPQAGPITATVKTPARLAPDEPGPQPIRGRASPATPAAPKRAAPPVARGATADQRGSAVTPQRGAT